MLHYRFSNISPPAFSNESANFLHIKAAAVALARTGHRQEDATEYIKGLNDHDRKELFSFAESKLPVGSKGIFDQNYKAQFQNFATRGIYFNIQTAEVVYQDGSLSPIPEDIALHPDFSGIFGSNAPQCSVLQPETNRRRYAIVDVSSDTKFEVACWKPQTSDEFNNTLRRANILPRESVPGIPGLAFSDASDSFSKQVASGVIGIPICCDDGRVSFCGHMFQPYEKGSCGWFSSLLDGIVVTSASWHSMPQPLIWICQSNEESSSNFVPWVIILAESSLEADIGKGSQCFFDANGNLDRKSDMARGFYEVLGNHHWMFIECFALRERGRAISREIVYTSDARLSLADLPESSRPQTEPMKQGREHEAGDLFSGMPVSKSNSEFLGAPDASCEEWKDPGLRSRITLVIKRTRTKQREIVETLVPHSSLRGLIPEILLENFTFWMQRRSSSDATPVKITGELRRDADPHFMGWGQESTIELEINSVGNQAKVWRSRRIRRCTDDGSIVNIDSGNGASSLFVMEALINLQQCSRESTIGQVVHELAHVDNLSHILVWSEEYGTDYSKSSAKIELHKIEMPRAGIFLRFQADDNISKILGGQQQQLGTTVVRVYSEDDDMFLGKSNISDSIAQFLHAIPHGAVFCNRFHQRFLVAPLWEPRPFTIALCPFEGKSRMRKPRRADVKRSLLKRNTTKFQLHIGETFLHSPDTFSSMYLTLLHLVKLDYLSAARAVRSCVTDGNLSDEMKWVLRLIGWTQLEPAGNLNPNAVALRLRIALQCCDGQLQECPWNLDVDYGEYLRKLSHVSPQCILTHVEELILLKQLISCSHRKRSKESCYKKGQEEEEDGCPPLPFPFFCTYLESRLKQLSSKTPELRVNVNVPNQRIGGVEWANFLAENVRDSLAAKKCGPPSQNWKSMHRPGKPLEGEEATGLLMTIRRDFVPREFSSVGFYPLYEVLAGHITFKPVGVTDGHSLASMMLQVVWITATQEFKMKLHRDDTLCVFVLAMMSARGFNDHMLKTQGHNGLLKNLPGYLKAPLGPLSRNAELLCGDGIRTRHPDPKFQRERTFSERLEGAACAVMRNKIRKEDHLLFTSTPTWAGHDNDGDMEISCTKGKFFADHDNDTALTQLFGTSPQFWRNHLKETLGHGELLFKENHTAEVIGGFAKSAGASNCSQSKLEFLSESKVSARTSFCVASEDPVELEENNRASSLDADAILDMMTVIRSVPRLSQFDLGTSGMQITPVLSCVFDEIPTHELIDRSTLQETVCDIPFPEMFTHGAAREFEQKARSKMATDLKGSSSSSKFQLCVIGPDFLAAMYCKSDSSFDRDSSLLFQKAISKLHDLHACLERHRQSTHTRVRQGVKAVNRLLYSFDHTGGDYSKSDLDLFVLKERLARTASLRPEFKFDDVVAICLSTCSFADLSTCNSVLSPELGARLVEATAAVMMHAVRLGHIIRCLSSTIRLIDDLVLFASERICARYPHVNLVDVKDLLISNTFSPVSVQDHLSSILPPSDRLPSSGDQQSSSELNDDHTFSHQSNSDVDDQPTSEQRTFLDRRPSYAIARNRSLRSIVKRQTSFDTSKSKQFSHFEIQLKTIDNSATSLANLLMEGRDYSVSSLLRIRSQVSPSEKDTDCSSAYAFDPRFLAVE